MAKKKKMDPRLRQTNRRPILILGVILMLFLGVVTFQVYNLFQVQMAKEIELKELQAELDEELRVKRELEVEKEFIKSEEFVIKRAREEFNLIKDGEILIIREEE